MLPNLHKRSLLVGRDLTKEIRPPGSLGEQAFIETCTQCYQCVEACPSKIIHKGSGGYPSLSFAEDGCLFCGECQRVCEPGALQAEGSPTWSAKASISDKCFNHAGVVCQSCQDACEYEALHFRYGIGGANRMELDVDCCTGCGACVSSCPANAIDVTP